MADCVADESSFNEAEALETSEFDIVTGRDSEGFPASMRPRLWRPRNMRKLLTCQAGWASFNEAEALETSEFRRHAPGRIERSCFNEAEALETSEFQSDQ